MKIIYFNNLLWISALNVQLVHLQSEFDIRASPLEEKRIAGCVVSGVAAGVSGIFFRVGEHEFPVPVPPAANGVMGSRRLNATLVTRPLAAFDKRWVSCLVRVDDTAVSSDSSFPLDIKCESPSLNSHSPSFTLAPFWTVSKRFNLNPSNADFQDLPSVISIELLNAFQSGDKWTINEGDQFNIICRVDGNPRPKVRVAVSSAILRSKIWFDFSSSIWIIDESLSRWTAFAVANSACVRFVRRATRTFPLDAGPFVAKFGCQLRRSCR